MRPRLVPEIISSDLQRSLAFYRDLLGFRILYDRPEDRFAFLELNGVELMIEQPHSHDRLWPNAELSYPFGRGVNLQIEVDDVDLLHAAVRTAGLEFYLPLEEKWYRREDFQIGVRQFVVQDPDGYIIRLTQDTGTRPV